MAEGKKKGDLAGALVSAGWIAVALLASLPLFVGSNPGPRSGPIPPSCQANLQRIGMSMGMYQDDNGEELPSGLRILIDERYLVGVGVPPSNYLKCPQDKSGIPVDLRYIDATSSYRYARVRKPASDGSDVPIMWDKTVNHGKDVVYVLFYDLHVNRTPVPELQAMIEKNKALYDKPPAMPAEP